MSAEEAPALARQDVASVQEFDTLLRETSERFESLVVQFTATWCKACHAIAADLHEAFEEERRLVNWVGVDVDALCELRDRYEIAEMPCVAIFYRTDDPVWKKSGRALVQNPLAVVEQVRDVDKRRPVFTADEDF